MHKLVALITGLLCAGSIDVRAQESGPAASEKPSPEHGPRLSQNRFPKHDLFERLELTLDQKTQIEKLKEADRQSLLEARDKVQIARDILEAAVREHPQDDAGIKAKAADLGAAVSTLITQVSMHRSRFLQILTGDQREKMEEFRRHRGRPHFGFPPHDGPPHEGSLHEGPSRDEEGPEQPGKPDSMANEQGEEEPDFH
jgi:Spy/CpxP family protein refolding chaperone